MSDKADSKENQSPNKLKKTLVSTLANQIDNDFERLLVFIKERDLNQITEAVKQNLRHFAATNYQTYKGSIDYFNKYKLWGSYYPENEDYELAENRADALVNHREDFEWIYKKLKDNRSKRIMVNILYYWLMSDTKRIEQISDRTFEQYFDLDIVKCSKKEVFVDIGGYIGDTIVSYSRVYGKDCYKKIYSYEIVPSGMEYIEKNIKLFGLNNVEVRQKGASSKNGSMYLASDDLSSVSQLSENGILEVPTVKIDDDIEGEVTFIKMDIEGGEEDALLGCLEKIRQYHPKLALSIYHNHKDIWKLARIIDEVDSSYKFYIRYYGSATLPAEYVLYAI
ncbi:FkbM family methyltransferase [Anaerocolumna sp. AGMB13025]|uniref:FkbM family methyltransferase n=1 Tax=Anaerocolumna sp. AGMB13025 TaxID=3039116 RepID=UPI00241BF829|nr:FkbM family methyltransferase [Anaerocolumna sp. AGMB13025]WFR55557.1 FkbM family methyltransferase [Anaerocolumna sp. AGMB13025]